MIDLLGRIASGKTGEIPAMLSVAVATVAAAAALVPAARAQSSTTAFVDVTVLPMDTERQLAHHTVLVRNGRIAAVGPVAEIALPKNAVQIDGRGQYLMPGFGVCHGHLGLGDAIPGEESTTLAELRLFRLLADGITVVRNADYVDPKNLSYQLTPFRLYGTDLLRLRDQAAAGELWSPRIYAAGQWGPNQYIDLKSHGHAVDSLRRRRARPRMDSIGAYVTAYKAAGYDVLKVHDESPEIFDSVLAAARRIALPVFGHIPAGMHERALAQGMSSIEHAYGFPDMPVGPGGFPDTATYVKRLVPAMAAARRRAGVSSCITGNGQFVAKALTDSGANVLFGGDDWGSDLERLSEMVNAWGLTPYEALATGTKNFGTYLRTFDKAGGKAGTIVVGNRADMVLLSKNPFEDVRHFGKPAVVMIGGRWLNREELDRRLEIGVLYDRLWSMGRFDAMGRSDTVASLFGESARSPKVTVALDSVHRAQRFALVEQLLLREPASKDRADSRAGAQKVVDLFARQLGDVRAMISVEAQTRFDAGARAWLREREAEGYRTTIPGVR